MDRSDVQSNREHRISFRQSVDLPSTTYGIFALYRYPAKFIPHVVAYILDRYANNGDTVFDPFAGYGTVGAVARIYGYDYELWDLNPILDFVHRIMQLRPREINVSDIITHLKRSTKTFVPDWSKFDYWFPSEFRPLLMRAWGGYYAIESEYEQLLLTIPLLKVSRQYSFDDRGRMKLSSSPQSRMRISILLESDWKRKFYIMLEKEINTMMRRLRENADLSTSRQVRAKIRAGVDTLHERLDNEVDLLITSPPYLQSQEYIRYAKMDLFWLGYSEKEISRLSRLEVPYRRVDPITIYSPTFEAFREGIHEDHMRKIYDTYFHAVLGTLERLESQVKRMMCIFVGRASLRGRQVPIDKILIEHFSQIGWTHEATLIDTIVARRMFRYQVNPATGNKDARAASERLVILKK
ncbi:MAG: site-specific DNA-methyltransferase [Candidatus Thorarchaeota archaeon]|nr:site-specific DNA-methyltransferase [Candidatus Thorarchaeota archaeon]